MVDSDYYDINKIYNELPVKKPIESFIKIDYR